jgi:hypothetical protein
LIQPSPLPILVFVPTDAICIRIYAKWADVVVI